jgi:hypothetical protein
MSYEGWKDRPILGYGQDNFSHVFAKYYDPAMYNQEPWFDRSHNVFFDWLVAGGILGLLSYLSLFAVALYLIFRVSGDLSKVEKTLLLGMLVTYFIHNLLVFDNLTSYILFFMILAFISGRTEGHLPRAPHKNVSEYQAILEPVVVVAVLVVFWFSVYKPYVANTLLIKGIDVTRLSNTMPLPQMIEYQTDVFKKALALNSFGSQEIREQVLTYGARLAQFNPNYSDPAQTQAFQKALQGFYTFTDEMIANMSEEDKNDVRQLSIIGGYLNAKQDYKRAEEALARSYELSPKKQRITFEYITALIRQNKTQEAYKLALETYLYEPKFNDAAIILAAASVYVGKEAEAGRAFAETGRQFPISVDVVNAYISIGNLPRALALLNDFKAQNPSQAAAVDAFIQQLYSSQKR